ncbi:hypothetical protein, partial [Polymorphospora rubra]
RAQEISATLLAEIEAEMHHARAEANQLRDQLASQRTALADAIEQAANEQRADAIRVLGSGPARAQVTSAAEALLEHIDTMTARCMTLLPRDVGETLEARAATLASALRQLAGPARAQDGVLAEIAAERARQDAKWGEQNHPDGTGPNIVWAFTGPAAYVAETARAECDRLHAEGHGTWRDILTEEVAEAYATDSPAALRAELVQVAAVVVAWVEAIDRRTAGQEPPQPQQPDAVQRAYADPSSVTPRRDGETLTQHTARAVMAVFDGKAPQQLAGEG